MSTNVEQFIADLDGGVLQEKLSRILSDVAAHVMDFEKKGEVSLKFDISKIGSSQVNVQHRISYKHPTKRGTKSEDDTTATPMHIGKGGAMSFFPENQGQLFTKKGEVNSNA